jgi:hypothetical protein
MSEEQAQPVEQAVEAAAPSFTDSLPEELRGEASLADFKDVSGLAKSYVSSQKMLGNSVRIPGEDASEEARTEFLQKLQQVEGVTKLPNTDNPEEVNAFYQTLGKPESLDGYNLDALEGQEVDGQTVASFQELAYNLNLTNQQANALASFEMQRQGALAEQMAASRDNSVGVLKEKWGPDYDNRMEGAKAALSMYEERFPEAVADIKNSPLGNNAAVISMLSELYGSLQESGAVMPTSSAGKYGISADEAASLNRIAYGDE